MERGSSAATPDTRHGERGWPMRGLARRVHRPPKQRSGEPSGPSSGLSGKGRDIHKGVKQCMSISLFEATSLPLLTNIHVLRKRKVYKDTSIGNNTYMQKKKEFLPYISDLHRYANTQNPHTRKHHTFGGISQ